MKILIGITLTFWLLLSTQTFSFDEIPYEKLIKITVNYDEKKDPNIIDISIKNTSDQDLEFKSNPNFYPYFIQVYSAKAKVSFPEELGQNKPKMDTELVQRKMAKGAEEKYLFNLSEVFKSKKNKYLDETYTIVVSTSYFSNIDKKNHKITSSEVKVNLKCKFEAVKEMAKIEISFPNNKIAINKSNVNFKIELQNLNSEPLTLLDEFSFNRTMEVTFIDEESGKTYTLCRISKWWEQNTDEPFGYLKLKPNEKMELKTSLSEQTISYLDLPKSKYKVYVRYGVNMGENCFNGFLRSDDVLVEKE